MLRPLVPPLRSTTVLFSYSLLLKNYKINNIVLYSYFLKVKSVFNCFVISMLDSEKSVCLCYSGNC